MLTLDCLNFSFSDCFKLSLRDPVAIKNDTLWNIAFVLFEEVSQGDLDKMVHILDNLLARCLNGCQSRILGGVHVVRVHETCDGWLMTSRSRVADIGACQKLVHSKCVCLTNYP